MATIPAKRETKKPKTAESKGKRYRCAICRKRASKPVQSAPYFCSNCNTKKKIKEFFSQKNG